MELSRRGIALATAALQLAAVQRAARATPLPAARPVRQGRRSSAHPARRAATTSQAQASKA